MFNVFRTGLPYKHQTNLKEIKKNYRDADGKVITENYNCTTGPFCKGLEKRPLHLKDEYDRPKEFARVKIEMINKLIEFVII